VKNDNKPWVYRVTVPPNRSDAFVWWLVQNGLIDSFSVVEEGSGV